ncbi:alpha/beta fold hydrolase [Jidongwangia harbinensis]|uniref:alpha/beta fold hydrolase n=1 Tax=Jidongwangia harbinensis TaxID=2878561 RepID=UPI001CD9CED0|nr:alpha/beta hydrolase [Jidongwangia harbinensis]MCA2211937.1 alpha/beta fold hydrolase [Jidongwangia harbinensis]
MTTRTGPSPQKSTNVRVFQVPRPVRMAFAVLNRASPALAARWAEQIWFTTPRRAAPARAVPVPGGSAFTVDTGGHRVVGQAWGTGPAVYLLHGWGGEASQLAGFVPPLVERGHRVVAFDAPSHGRSAPGAYGPRSSTIPEFAAALTAVVDACGPAHAVIAHSMGGAATAVALCDGLRADRVALLAPMAGTTAYGRRLAGLLGLGEPAYRRLVARAERRVGAPMHHFDVPALGRAVAMPSTLVVHDRDDAFTPVGDGLAIAAAWPSARLHLTTGLGHRRLLRDPGVVAEVVGFVAGGRLR